MISAFSRNLVQPSVGSRVRSMSLIGYILIALVSGIAILIGLTLKRYGVDSVFGPVLAGLCFVILIAITIHKPRYGLYFIIFFSLAGDSILLPWYPFLKNFSSRESILFIHDSLIVSPLEVCLIFVIISWAIRGLLNREFSFFAGKLFWSAVPFFFFVILGLAYGIGSGGSVNVALWEVRPIFYMFIMMVLTSNLIEKREHASHLLWFAIMGLFIEALIGSYHFIFTLNGSLSGVNEILEHSASLHINTIIVFFLATWIYKTSATKRLVIPLLLPFLLLTYLANQRRAAFVTLAIALFLLAIILFIDNRRAFWLIVPPILFIGIVYMIGFWNSSAAIAQPAQAIKSVIAEDQSNTSDQASNAYRDIENYNIYFTIRSKPVTGVGFGQKFYIPIAMPDISFFEWWEYLTHNSIMWIWLQTGIAGFISLLFLIGSALMLGVRAYSRMPQNGLKAIALTATLYLVMHFIYAYVDISWDSQSMIYVGVMMGLINSLERIVEKPVPLQKKRWPWQPEPEPVPALVSLDRVDPIVR